jgi:hypothetical protein
MVCASFFRETPTGYVNVIFLFLFFTKQYNVIFAFLYEKDKIFKLKSVRSFKKICMCVRMLCDKSAKIAAALRKNVAVCVCLVVEIVLK